MSKYMSVVDTAKLIRKALKESFPSVKFSVRSEKYAGGASVNVSWTDGATISMVDPILNMFKGAYFDPMIDYQGSITSTYDGEEVKFGAQYISSDRDYSNEAIEKALARLKRKYPEKWNKLKVEPTVEGYNNNRGTWWSVLFFDDGNGLKDSLLDAINEELYKFSFVMKAEASKILEKFGERYSDGYGNTIPDKNGESCGGYPSC